MRRDQRREGEQRRESGEVRRWQGTEGPDRVPGKGGKRVAPPPPHPSLPALSTAYAQTAFDTDVAWLLSLMPTWPRGEGGGGGGRRGTWEQGGADRPRTTSGGEGQV